MPSTPTFDMLRFATAPPDLEMNGAFTGLASFNHPYYSFGDPTTKEKHFIPSSNGFGPGGPVRIEALAPDQAGLQVLPPEVNSVAPDASASHHDPPSFAIFASSRSAERRSQVSRCPLTFTG